MTAFSARRTRVLVCEFLQATVLPPLRWPQFESILAAWTKAREDPLTVSFDVFPALACQAAGGDPSRGIPLAAAWLCFVIGARVFDDLQDEDGPGEAGFPTGVQAALPVGLYALGAASTALSHLLLEPEALADVLNAFGKAQALAASAQGERLDLAERSVEGYFANVAAKTGLILATGAWAGARVSCQEPSLPLLDAFYQYGLAVGMMTQILDDCRDLAKVDLPAGIYTLPVIYALSQRKHPSHRRLLALLDAFEPDADWARQTMSVLEGMGAVAWSLDVAAVYQAAAVKALGAFPEQQVAPLLSYAGRDHALLV